MIRDYSIGIASINDFAKEVSELSLPFAAKNFRYCDLLNGNDIPRILTKILDVKKKFGNYDGVPSIPIEDFAFFIRTPILVYDEFLFIDGRTIKPSSGKPLNNADNVTVLVVRTDKPIPDFQAMLNELTLEYAKNRMRYLNEHPKETDESLNWLVENTLHNEMYNIPNKVVKGHNQLTPPLIGLYCWDLIQDYSWEYIFKKLEGEFNISLAKDTIKEYYRYAKKEIDSLVTASVTR